MEEAVFTSFAIALAIASLIGILAMRFKQPLVIAYILAGVLIGPSVLNILPSTVPVATLSNFAVALLLFIIGIRFDMGDIKSNGRNIIILTLVRGIAPAATAFIILYLSGLPLSDTAYISLGMTFASTIVVVKGLADRDELEALHGRLAVGVLIAEDMIVIVIMLVVSALGAAAEEGGILWLQVLKSVGIAAAFVVGALLIGRFVLDRVMIVVADVRELTLLFGIAWATSLAALGNYLGVGIELGAFVAGLSLSSNAFREELLSRILPIRDFLLIFFFMNLGIELNLGSVLHLLPMALILSVATIVVVPLAIMLTMRQMGYHRMTSFYVGVSLTQVSEFSLVLVSAGVTTGVVSQASLSLITIVAIITIAISTYLIRYAGKLYRVLAKPLRFLQRKVLKHEDTSVLQQGFYDAIIFGMNHYGIQLATGLSEMGMRILAVDYDPHVARRTPTSTLTWKYGDIEDPELPNFLPIATTRFIICNSSKPDQVTGLMRELEDSEYRGTFIATSYGAKEDEVLRKAGVRMLLHPADDAAKRAMELLLKRTNMNEGETGRFVDPVIQTAAKLEPVRLDQSAASVAVGDGALPGLHAKRDPFEPRTPEPKF